MLELFVCSLVTILPDYLYRRYVQGKRFGREITFYTVWYELRWGITGCLVLTISLITMIFYFHPSTTNVTSLFRTVTILPETGGRVAEVFVKINEAGRGGTAAVPPRQHAAGSRARGRPPQDRRSRGRDGRRQDPARRGGRPDPGSAKRLSAGRGRVPDQDRSCLRRNASTVSEREVQRLEVAVAGREGGVSAAIASKATIEEQIASLLPAQKASAEAALQEAQVALDKTMVRAGIAGTVAQFYAAGPAMWSTRCCGRPASSFPPEPAPKA